MLWCAVSALQKALPRAKILIFCDERLSPAALRASALRTFGVELERDVEVAPLTDVRRLDPERHPRLTLVSQSLAGAALAFEGLRGRCRRGRGGGPGPPAPPPPPPPSGPPPPSPPPSSTSGGGAGVPALFIDTGGWSLSYFVAKAAGCDVAAYVHYPIVSSDMLARVGSGESGEKGKESGARLKSRLAVAAAAGDGASTSSSSCPQISSLAGKIRSSIKTAYYHAVASAYGAAGGVCDVAVANSSWTAGHLEQLWWRRPRGFLSLLSSSTSPSPGGKGGKRFSSSTIVYPPCGVSSLEDLPLERAPLPEEVFGKTRKKKREKERLLIALAQFRPEKNQAALLRALALARERASKSSPSHPVLSARLALVGGVRDAADEARVEELRALARELGLASGKKEGRRKKEEEAAREPADGEDADDAVVFVTNAPRETLRLLLSSAVGGLHAMVDEHFGICVVEYMAAGVVPLAHDSAGPRMDIVKEEEEGEEEEAGGGGDGKSATARRATAGAAATSSPSSSQKKSSTPTGFLCSTESEYADAISELMLLSQEEEEESGGRKATRGGKEGGASTPAIKMAASARRRALRLFTDEAFDAGFVDALRPLLARVERGCLLCKELEEEEETEKNRDRENFEKAA